MYKIILFVIMPVLFLYAQSNDDCMMCHGDQELTGLDKNSQEIPMSFEIDLYNKSVHNSLACIDCHQDLDGIEEYPHSEELQSVFCGNCHGDIQAEYSESMHGLKFVNMEETAPKCSDCHSKHNILSPENPDSRVYFQNVPLTCCGCHESKNDIRQRYVKQPCVREEFLKGVHGKLIIKGEDIAPTCNTCHPSHNIRKRVDPQSTIFKLNIANTCGQCHIDELASFGESIHARAVNHGIFESATCTDCHNEHEILHPDSADLKASHDVCIKCHNDENLMRKYDLPKTVVSTYEDSYHGRSVKLGGKNVATCASCHDHHDIYSHEEPYSTVNKDNLAKTCGKCHDNVTESFAQSYTHEAMLIRSNPINFYITIIYVVLIVGVIGGMILHNLIILMRYIKYKRKAEKQYYVIRFKGQEIFQHAVLMISFTVLAISGFALRFPDAWWVQIFTEMGIDEWGRRIIHRVSGIVMVSISLYHLYYITLTKRGKYLFKYIMIRYKDVPEIIQTVKYYLGFAKKKPEYDEFDYTEKVEYWAVVWGTIVMGITGFILWFPVIVTSFAPSWIIRASELIHYYEAILATLAIVVFHLFFVIAHPEQYPMNLSWFTGKMSLDAAVKKHPQWVERLLQEKSKVDLLPEVIQVNCKSIDDVEKYLKFGEQNQDVDKDPIH
jgi:cytochrome b subunit of formate dehydrogenase